MQWHTSFLHSKKLHSAFSLSSHSLFSTAHSPLGKSFGLTNSLKKSCAICACFSSLRNHWRNQKRSVRDSCECLPVLALTRNTRNSSDNCAGTISLFCPLTVSLFMIIPVWSPPATWTRSFISSTSLRSISITVLLTVLPFGVITTCSRSVRGGVWHVLRPLTFWLWRCKLPWLSVNEDMLPLRLPPALPLPFPLPYAANVPLPLAAWFSYVAPDLFGLGGGGGGAICGWLRADMLVLETGVYVWFTVFFLFVIYLFVGGCMYA